MAPKGDRHWLDLAGLDHDGWWDSRPGALRSTVQRKAKKGVVDIALFTAFDADAWGDYEQIYAASWKPAEGDPALRRAFAKRSEESRLGQACVSMCRLRWWPCHTEKNQISK